MAHRNLNLCIGSFIV